MKKFILVICIAIVIIASFSYVYYSYVYTEKSKMLDRKIFESYLKKEIYGTQVASIINKVIDLNEQNNIPKGTNGIYLNDDRNSIELEVLFIDNDKVYNGCEIYNGGINTFVQYYGQIKFRCNEILYHTMTGNISKIVFSQIE